NQIYLAMDAQDDLTIADVIICLGGDPQRVLEAARLCADGYAPVLVVSNQGEAAQRMARLAVDWGAPADRVVVDAASRRTSDHPAAVAAAAGLDIARDRCIVVTSYTHLARSRAVFEAAGYRHLIMREPRWER